MRGRRKKLNPNPTLSINPREEEHQFHGGTSALLESSSLVQKQ